MHSIASFPRGSLSSPFFFSASLEPSMSQQTVPVGPTFVSARRVAASVSLGIGASHAGGVPMQKKYIKLYIY
ncbi:MAG: hypothetical protein ACFB6R_01665 [Alphaproteobacteria bacterium]